MKNKNIIVLFIIFLILSVSAKAQNWKRMRYEFYYGIGISTFMGDVMAPINKNAVIWMDFFNTMGPIANVGLRYLAKERHHFSGNASIGQLYAKETPNSYRFYYRGLKFSTAFLELSVRYEYLFLKERSRKTIYRKFGESKWKNFMIPSYLFIGVGGLVNGGVVTHNYNRVSDKKNYINGAFVIPYGIGFKAKVNYLLYINLEVGARFTFSDGIDYVEKNNFSNIQGGAFVDQYGFISVNVIHKLGSNRKGMPKFKKY